MINSSVGVWRLVAPLPQVCNKPGQLPFLCSSTRETDHSSARSFGGLAHSSSEKHKFNISCRSARQTSSKGLPLSSGGLGVGPFRSSVQEFNQSVLLAQRFSSFVHVCCWFKKEYAFGKHLFPFNFISQIIMFAALCLLMNS